jgi:hypothetical protein
VSSRPARVGARPGGGCVPPWGRPVPTLGSRRHRRGSAARLWWISHWASKSRWRWRRRPDVAITSVEACLMEREGVWGLSWWRGSLKRKVRRRRSWRQGENATGLWDSGESPAMSATGWMQRPSGALLEVWGLDGVKTTRKGEARLERHQWWTGGWKFLRLCSTCFATKEKRMRGASAYWHPHGWPSVPSRKNPGRAARDGVWPCQARCQAAAVLLGTAYGT